MVFLNINRLSGDVEDKEKDFRSDELFWQPLLDGIAPEMMDTKIGQSNKLQFTPANIARQVHKRAGPSIYLRGMNLEYRFELATQQLNDEFGTGLCLCIMLVNDKYDWFREKSDLFRGRWGRDYRYGHVYSQ